MKPKIRIPRKGYFGVHLILSTLLLFASTFFIYLSIRDYPKDAITPLSLYLILGTLLPALIVWILCYYNLYKYYAPKFRTTEVRSLMDMLALGEGRIYEVVDDHIINFNLVLRYCELGTAEPYYIHLQVPEEEVEYFDFRKKIELIGNQRLSGISFHRIPCQSEGEKKFRVGYKFWTLKSEKELLFSVPNLTC